MRLNLRKVRFWLILYVLFDLYIGGHCAGIFPLGDIAAAQFTTVTGTVIDPNGIPYALGTISAKLILPGGTSPTLNGFAYTPPTQPTGLDVTGSFTMQLADNTVLLPGSTQWSFTVCSAVGTVLPSGGKGPVCFTAGPITISGSSQSISSQLQAVALTLLRLTVKTPIIGTSSTINLPSASTAFVGLYGNNSETNVNLPMPLSGTMKNLRIVLNSGGGNVGVNYTFTVRQNASSTAITCAISGAATLVCTDLTHSISVTAGDLIDIQSVPTASPNPTGINWSIELDPQ